MNKYKINQEYKIFSFSDYSYVESKLLKITLEDDVLYFIKDAIFNSNPLSEEDIISIIGYENFYYLLDIGLFLKDHTPNNSKIFHTSTSMGNNYFPWKKNDDVNVDDITYKNVNNGIRKSERRFSNDFNIYKTQIALIRKIISKCYGANYFNGHRGIPSAGNLYPLNIYLIINSSNYYKVLSFNPISYKFDEYCSLLTLEELFVGKDITYNKVPFYIFLTYSPDKNQMKYGDRGYRLALLEAGMFSQQFNNFLIDEGMGMINLGSYIEYKFEENLFINEWMIHCIGFGKVS